MQKVFEDCGYKLDKIEQSCYDNPVENAYKYIMQMKIRQKGAAVYDFSSYTNILERGIKGSYVNACHSNHVETVALLSKNALYMYVKME